MNLRLLLKTIILLPIVLVLISCVKVDETSKLTYDVYEVEQHDVVVSLYVPTELDSNSPIYIFSNIRYIGENNSVYLLHGSPIINYWLYNNEGSSIINQGQLSIGLKKKLLKSDLLTIPLVSDIDPEKIKHLLEQDKKISVQDLSSDEYDPTLFLDEGEYRLVVNPSFSVENEDMRFDQNIEITIQVK